jgi:hypothetical protein
MIMLLDQINHLYMVLLPAAVVAMWLVFKRRADTCDEDRRRLWKALSRLSGIVHAAKNCPVTDCHLRQEAEDALEQSEEDLSLDQARDNTMKRLGMKDSTQSVCYHVPHPQV